jgi:hypothetical protein
MSFLQDLVDNLPGATTEKNPLMGGQTLSDFYSNTHTGNASDNGFAAIYATDPTIQLQRMINGVDRSTGGNGNIFTDQSMQEQAGIANTIGKMLAADWAGGVAGESAGEASAASGANASTVQQVGNVAQGATVGGTAAAMNNQSVAEGATVGAVAGAFAPTTTTDPTAVTQAAPTATEVALQRAGQSAATTAAKGGNSDEILTSAGTGAISGTTANMNPTIAGAINGAVGAGLAYDKAGQKTEDGALAGLITGGVSGYAGDATYDATGSNKTAQAAAQVAGDVAGYAVTTGTDLGMKPPELPPDPQFEAYMKQMTSGYTPQVADVINPIILAAVGNGLTVEQTETTQLNNGGVSPLITQGA